MRVIPSRLFAALLTVLVLTACSTTPPERNPSFSGDELDVLLLTDVGSSPLPWWTGAGGPVLDAWVANALHPDMGVEAWLAKKELLGGFVGAEKMPWSGLEQYAPAQARELARFELTAAIVRQYVLLKSSHNRMGSLERSLGLLGELAEIHARTTSSSVLAGMTAETVQVIVSAVQTERMTEAVALSKSRDALAVLTSSTEPPDPPAGDDSGWNFPQQLELKAEWLRGRPDVRSAEQVIVKALLAAGVPAGSIAPRLELVGQLALSNGEVSIYSTDDENLATLGLAMPLPGWVASLGVTGETTEGKRIAEALQNYRRAVSDAWEDCLIALEDLGVAQIQYQVALRDEERALTELKQVKARADAGTATRAELLKASLDAEDVRRMEVTAGASFAIKWLAYQLAVFGKG